MYNIDISYEAETIQEIIDFVNLGIQEGVKIVIEYFKHPNNDWASLIVSHENLEDLMSFLDKHYYIEDCTFYDKTFVYTTQRKYLD